MILALVELEAGAVSELSLETLTLVRASELPLHVVVVGAVGPEVGETLAAYGVERVHEVTGPSFEAYSAAAWAAAVVAAHHAIGGASVVTASGTSRGTDVLAHVACRLGVAMAANVVELDQVSPLVVSRQVLGGAVLEETALPDAVGLFTVAGHACEPQPAAVAGAASAQPLDVVVEERDLAARVVRIEPGEADASGSLKSAKVVVGAGRGAGSADGFAELLELAELLGGSLGVSRVVTSLGWRPHHEQIGQTGSRISPDLYIACGISGAIQHWAGMSSAKTILAINTDPDAPMVTKAHYAVIGDLHEVVPAINAELRARR